MPRRDTHFFQPMEKQLPRISNDLYWVRCHRPAVVLFTEGNRFPRSVPNDTSIPSWAYLKLRGDDFWDLFASAKSEMLSFQALNIRIDRPIQSDATNGAWTPPQSGTNLSIPAIVGISLGATALATLIAFLLLLWCRQRSDHKGAPFVLYDRIGGPPRKPGGIFSPSKKVTSYRPGLNFDLIKNRTGDLVELTPPSQDQTRAQSSWGSVSVSSLVNKVRTSSTTTRHENYPQKQPGHESTSALSSIFTRPKEVRSQVVPPDFDISAGL